MQTHAENACRNAALVVSVHNVTTKLKLELKKIRTILLTFSYF